uniref:BRISC and BRCA1 A complex member 1 n=1 Tax=Papio anubis TaxID=9555 RepID=A0A2I3M2C4_PAPAN
MPDHNQMFLKLPRGGFWLPLSVFHLATQEPWKWRSPAAPLKRRRRKRSTQQSLGPALAPILKGLRTGRWGHRPAWAAAARVRVRPPVLMMGAPTLQELALSPGKCPRQPLRSKFGHQGSTVQRRCSKTNALNVSQKMIEMFVRTKHKIDKSHEFALVVVNDDTAWLSGLTSDPRELCSCLYDLETASCSTFNLEGLFSLIQQKTELPVTENVQTIPPPYVVRTILVYSRPPCQPQFSLTEPMKKMFQCPYFFFDVVYIHNGTEEKEEEMSWKDMFAFMGSLDTKGTSYKYEVALAGPALELHNCMAKLLAHPLQRPCQSHASYSLLEEEDEATEVEATV